MKKESTACCTQIPANAPWIIAILIVAAVAAFIVLAYKPSGGELVLGNQNITNYEGTYKVLNATTIAIVMDGRGITQDNRVKVFNCGTAFAQGLGTMGKTVNAFALQDDYCIGPDMNRISVEECNTQIHANDYIIMIMGTNQTPIAQYYADHFLVEVPENDTKGCSIKTI